MRGASAVDRILKEHPDTRVRVFAVWTPMLPTDVIKPSRIVLSRLSDRRVQQFWDPQQVLPVRLGQDSPGRHPECCEDDGKLWDMAAVYPPGGNWDQTLPTPLVFDGTVEDVKSRIAAALVSRPQ